MAIRFPYEEISYLSNIPYPPFQPETFDLPLKQLSSNIVFLRGLLSRYIDDTTGLLDNIIETRHIKDKAVTITKLSDELQKLLTDAVASSTIFIGSTEPINPIEGTRWFDTSLNVIKIFTDNRWITISGTHQSTFEKIRKSKPYIASGIARELEEEVEGKLIENGVYSNNDSLIFNLQLNIDGIDVYLPKKQYKIEEVIDFYPVTDSSSTPEIKQGDRFILSEGRNLIPNSNFTEGIEGWAGNIIWANGALTLNVTSTETASTSFNAIKGVTYKGKVDYSGEAVLEIKINGVVIPHNNGEFEFTASEYLNNLQLIFTAENPASVSVTSVSIAQKEDTPLRSNADIAEGSDLYSDDVVSSITPTQLVERWSFGVLVTIEDVVEVIYPYGDKGYTGDTLLENISLTQTEKGLGYKLADLDIQSFFNLITDPRHNLFIGDKGYKQVRYEIVRLDEEFVDGAEAITYQGESFTFDNFAYKSGDRVLLPLVTIQRRNLGIYHPLYNEGGTGMLFYGGKAVKSYEVPLEIITSLKDVFDPNKIAVINTSQTEDASPLSSLLEGSVSDEVFLRSGLLNSVSGRISKSGVYADEVSVSDVEVNLINANQKSLADIFEEALDKMEKGEFRGKEGSIKYARVKNITQVEEDFIRFDGFEYDEKSVRGILRLPIFGLKDNKITALLQVKTDGLYLGDSKSLQVESVVASSEIDEYLIPYHDYQYTQLEKVDRHYLIGDPRKYSERVKYEVADGLVVDLEKGDYVLNQGNYYISLATRSQVDLSLEDFTDASLWVNIGVEDLGGYDLRLGIPLIFDEKGVIQLPQTAPIVGNSIQFKIGNLEPVSMFLRKKDGSWIEYHYTTIEDEALGYKIEGGTLFVNLANSYQLLGYSTLEEYIRLMVISLYSQKDADYTYPAQVKPSLYLKDEIVVTNYPSIFYGKTGSFLLDKTLKGDVKGLTYSGIDGREGRTIAEGANLLHQDITSNINNDTNSDAVKFVSYLTQDGKRLKVMVSYQELRFNDWFLEGNDLIFHKEEPQVIVETDNAEYSIEIGQPQQEDIDVLIWLDDFQDTENGTLSLSMIDADGVETSTDLGFFSNYIVVSEDNRKVLKIPLRGLVLENSYTLKMTLDINNFTRDTSQVFDVLGDNSAVALWTLDGHARDEGGVYHGTWYGTEQYAEGVFGQCAYFNGSSYIATRLLLNTGFSVLFWAFAFNNESAYCMGASNSTDRGDNWNIGLAKFNGGYCDIDWRNTLPTNFNYSEWHFYAFIFPLDGNIYNTTLFVDGIAIPSPSIGLTTYCPIKQNGYNFLNIGLDPYHYTRYKTSNFIFYGKLAQIRIFNRPLSPTEIANIYEEQRIYYDKAIIDKVAITSPLLATPTQYNIGTWGDNKTITPTSNRKLIIDSNGQEIITGTKEIYLPYTRS